MNKLQAGFARVNITPKMGIGIGGYFKPRYVEGILDELEINALAVACDDDKAVIISIDNLELQVPAADDFRNHISEVTGVSADCIYIHATHSHTTPFIEKGCLHKYATWLPKSWCGLLLFSMPTI